MNSSTTYEIGHLVDGKAVGVPEQRRVNPARTADLVARTAVGDAETVAAAVAAAKAAQPHWAGRPTAERGQILARVGELLHQRAERIACDLTREEGKTLPEALGEVRRAAEIFRFFGGEGFRFGGQTFPSGVPDTFVYTKKEALGVVGLITPWNFPIAIPAWKSAPALIAGNAVVIKPAALTPVSLWHLAQAIQDAGTPPGVFNVVHGPGSVVGAAIVEHPDVAAVSFTGSTNVGLGIHDGLSRRRARAQLEMGGKNALVVLDDADPQRAAQIAAAGAFGLTGQACTATSRVICTPKAHDDFLEALTSETASYRAGDGQHAGVLMGPVVSAAQSQTNREYVEIATHEGARVVAGGRINEEQWFDPVVLGDVLPGHRIAQEEVFGPVLSVLRARGLDEAIELANDARYGLSAGIVTNDLHAAHRFADGVQAGVVKVNRPTGGVDLNVPFGGVKDSSTNTYREQGAAAVDFYTWTKAVYVGHDVGNARHVDYD